MWEDKDLNQIQKEDLESLIINKVEEAKLVEYKSALNIETDPDKEKFLANVSSFANASGGHILFGLKEEKGVPVELCGVQVSDVDQLKLRLEQIIRDGVEPRIFGINIVSVSVNDGKSVLIIRIPQSWNTPHKVKRKGSGFYSRNSAGKYQLDITELRSAFLATETVADRINNFRADRVSRILSNDGPVSLLPNAKTVLHIIPFCSFTPGYVMDLRNVRDENIYLFPLYAAGSNSRYNCDGYMTYHSSEASNSPCNSYLQLFRNGIIETADSVMLTPFDEKKTISQTSEVNLLKELKAFILTLRRLGVQPPIAIMLTLLSVRGYIIEGSGYRRRHPVDRDHLLAPGVILNDYRDDLTQTMKPAFDMIWNSSGWEQSMNYDEDGKWRWQ